MLKLVPLGSLEDRRKAVLARLMERLPFTIRVLRQMLTAICGEGMFEIYLQHQAYHINVVLQITQMGIFEVVRAMLLRVLPANLTMGITAIKELPEETATIAVASTLFRGVMTTILLQYSPIQLYGEDLSLVTFRGTMDETILPKFTQEE
jgi:uncharacterized membrane protein